jgi:hypothetical protein
MDWGARCTRTLSPHRATTDSSSTLDGASPAAYARTVKARPGEHEDLRLPAKVADREKAAESQRPELERRLAALGYPPRAIADAYMTLSGPGTVEDALAKLKGTQDQA